MSRYSNLSAVLAVTTALLGIAIIATTAVHGGGTAGYLIGLLFIAAGVGRLYLMRRQL
ncbi:MAG TPA: hypothetical protein VFW85_02405 [Gaiellaceae bacterium]|nr:hypothetical protein [Gaiellaceae bacterium]